MAVVLKMGERERIEAELLYIEKRARRAQEHLDDLQFLNRAREDMGIRLDRIGLSLSDLFREASEKAVRR